MMRFKEFKIFLLPVFTFLCLSSCISRLSRPQITGIVVDYHRNPVAGCKVGETYTEKDGSFSLSEKRYNAFFLKEIFVMEAPPLMVHETIEKDGFVKDGISIFSKWGGGQPKGALYKIDTIFLKQIHEKIDLQPQLKNSDWKLSFTKSGDTLYLIKSGYENWCKTDRCSPVYSAYSSQKEIGAGGAIDKDAAHKTVKRNADLHFNADGLTGELKQDTISARFVWQTLRPGVFRVDFSGMELISGMYNISDQDLYSLILIRKFK